MTSKISFYNRLKEEFRHHIVSMLLIVLYFMAKLLLYYFKIQDIVNREMDIKELQNLVNASVAPTFQKMIPVILLAAFLAAEYFSYLHSKKKSDFYMSLPISRAEKFVIGAVMSAVMFLVPCLLERCAETIIAFSSGYATLVFTENLLLDLICTLLVFAASWVTMALAMIMTGNMIVGILGYGAFCSYVPAILKDLLPAFEEVFFVTYARSEKSDWWYYFSPISLASGLTIDFSGWEFLNHSNYLVAIILFTGIVGTIAFCLYKKRPAEAAGRAMAFEKFNTVIKFAIVIPLALYCGYIISLFTVVNAKIWLVIGTIFGAVLLHGIMESVYRFDIRGMLEKKKHLVASVVLCIGFISLFWLDIFKYNEYIPNENDVESVKMTIYGDNISFYEINLNEEEREGISGKRIHTVLVLAENMIAQLDENDDESENQEQATGIERARDISNDSNLFEITVRYRLKNGSEECRYYEIDLDKEENRTLLDLICATEEFKDDYYELYKVDSEEIEEISVGDSFMTERVLLSAKDQEEFISIYKEELTSLTISQMEELDKWAALTFMYKSKSQETCYIYSGFEQTIDFLSEHGYEITPSLKEYEIVSLEMYDEYVEFIGDVEGVFVVREQGLLESIKEELILEELYIGYVYQIPNARYANVEFRINDSLQTANVILRQETVSKLKNEKQ